MKDMNIKIIVMNVCQVDIWIIFKQMKSNKSIEPYNQQEVKFTELPYNHQETLKLQALPIYNKYKSWLKDNGVILDPRVRYPSYFGSPPNGIIGISASKPIQRKKAIIAVPYDLLITVNKVKQNKDLNAIINSSFSVFGKNDDFVLKILLLYVIHQMLKAEKSFYYPYFSICLADYVEGWSKWSAYKIQHRGVIRDLKLVQEEIELQFMKFLRIFRIHEKVFPANISNTQYKQIFERAYYMVTTRAFGWSLPSISLIPLADSLNHGNLRFLNHFVTNIDLEKDSQCTQLKNRSRINLTLLKDQYFNLNNEEATQLRRQPKSKVVRFIEKHKQILHSQGQNQNCKSKSEARGKQYNILHQQYKAGVHKLRNLHFYESSCSQDNDTDEQEIYERQNSKETFELQDLQRVITQPKKKAQIAKHWKLYRQFQQSEEEDDDEDQGSKKSLPKINNEQLKKEILEKMNTNQDSSEIESNQSQDQDQQFGWFEKANQARTYFVMNTQETIRENEQIYNFYGRRSNKFLLLGYNFIMKDNIYDSFTFNLVLDNQINVKAAASKLVQKSKNSSRTREIRLKRYRINKDLINLCRSYIILWSKKEYKNCRIVIPFDLEVQNKTLQLYKEFISHFLKEFTTTLEEDEQEQEEVKLYSDKLAVWLRIQFKKMLLGQMNLINKCLQFLKRWKIGQIQQFQQSQMIWVKRTKPYLLELQKASSL